MSTTEMWEGVSCVKKIYHQISERTASTKFWIVEKKNFSIAEINVSSTDNVVDDKRFCDKRVDDNAGRGEFC